MIDDFKKVNALREAVEAAYLDSPDQVEIQSDEDKNTSVGISLSANQIEFLIKILNDVCTRIVSEQY